MDSCIEDTIGQLIAGLWSNGNPHNVISSRIVKLLGLVAFATCLGGYLLFTTESLAVRTFKNFQTPPLPSYPYVEVVYPKEGSPEYGILWPYRNFKSSPFHPPYFNITGNGGQLSDGYLFMTPKSRTGNGSAQNFPIIIGQDNELVYCLDKPANGNNLRVQSVNGTPHLTVWQGNSIKGHGYGNFLVLDSNYDEYWTDLDAPIYTIKPEFDGQPMDFHDQVVTDRGTVLVTVYNTSRHDLTPLGGQKDAWVANSLIYEIDIQTKDVLFTWSALDHFKVTDSRLPMNTSMGHGAHPLLPFDFFHLNSIQPFGDDALLISCRHFWAVFLISRKTGQVLWELNGSGKGGDFGGLPSEGQFRWQHHAQAHNITSSGFTLSIFDNHNIEEETNVTSTRGILLSVSLPPDSSTPPPVLRSLQPDQGLFVNSQGSYEVDLSNGNQLLGLGPIPMVREFGPSGYHDLRWEGRFGYDDRSQSYRTFKQEWRATPVNWKPSLVFEKNATSLTGYVSWNGATDVEHWNIYEVKKDAKLERLGKAMARGFETVIEIPDKFGHVECIVAAAMQDGAEVAKSNTACWTMPIQ